MAVALTLLGLACALMGRAGAVDASIWAGLAATDQLSARFTQVQHRAILRAPLVSEGSLSYARQSGHLSWQVEKPSRSRFTLDGSIARTEYPDLGISETYDLAQVPEASRVAASMMVWLRADPAQVEAEFTVRYEGERVTLAPKDATLKALLAEIQLTVVPDPWRVSRVELVEPDQDRVVITFHDVVLDGRPVEG